MGKIPFHMPSIGPEEEAAVLSVLRSGWLTTGVHAKAFEEEFASFVGAKHALAVNSATSALHLGLDAARVGPGDRVIVPTMTFTATAEVVRYVGAEPVMVDCDVRTLNLDPGQVEQACRSGPIKAIMPVHFAGLACDMRAIRSISERHGCAIVEDAAHAFPSLYDGQHIGSGAFAAAFSFYVTKTLTTGEGGMLSTNSDEVAHRARIMRLHGISRDAFDRYRSDKPNWHYEVVAPGFKYNMPDLAASIGRVQLRRAGELRAKRKAIADRYNHAFAHLPVTLPADAEDDHAHAWHLYVLRLGEDSGISRNEAIQQLNDCGVGTSVHFIPLHCHPYWRQHCHVGPADFPVAQAAYESMMSLPLFPDMSEVQIQHVIDAVSGLFR